ncbi:MAG: OmpA family protein [Pirellula sp.]
MKSAGGKKTRAYPRAYLRAHPAGLIQTAVWTVWIGLIAIAGCQRSQPNVLGSVPNYLRPYNPGAPASFPEASPAGVAVPGAAAVPGPPTSAPLAVSPSSNPTSSLSDPANFGYAAQISELERRARLLDENNRQLHSQLAQAQQQVQTYRERSDLMQQQLGDMSAQLQQARIAASRSVPTTLGPTVVPNNPAVPPTNPLLAGPTLPSAVRSGQANPVGVDSPKRSGARLTANTSRGLDSSSPSSIEPLRSLGYPLETNGNALRIRIPSDQIFQPGSSDWTASAGPLLERVSSALRTASPHGQLSIDCHTDNASASSLGVAGAEQLTSQQADALLNYLVSRGGWNPGAVIKHANGSDIPLMDNQTPAGRAANRRIEFIIAQDR